VGKSQAKRMTDDKLREVGIATDKGWN
jgi:hypothetical protein